MYTCSIKNSKYLESIFEDSVIAYDDIINTRKVVATKFIIKMESNDKLKDIDIKIHTCYYFNNIMKFQDFNLDNILIDEKSHENILVYNISYKNLIDGKPLCIRFDNIDGFIRVNNGTR